MTQFEVKNPMKIEFTLTTTLSLENWIALKKQLDGNGYNHPAYDFIRKINDMVSQATESFYPKRKEEEE